MAVKSHEAPQRHSLCGRGRTGHERTCDGPSVGVRTWQAIETIPSPMESHVPSLIAPPVAELLQRQSIHPAPICQHPFLSLGQCVQPAPKGEASTLRHASRTGATTASIAGQSAAVAYKNAAGGGLTPSVFPTADRRRCAVYTRPPAYASRGVPRMDERVEGSSDPLLVGEALGTARPPIMETRPASLGRGQRADGRWDAPDRWGEAGGEACVCAVSSSPAPRHTRTPQADAAHRRHSAAQAHRGTQA